ncbi:MAG TPA: hypothetical protein VF981_18275 [Gemmatimonadaceae bacterium]
MSRVAAAAAQGSTPAGVKPVLARTPASGHDASPAVAVATAPRPAESRVRPTPWNPPAAFVPAPQATAHPPAPVPPPSGSPTAPAHAVTTDASRPEPTGFVSTPLGQADRVTPARDRPGYTPRSAPTYRALDTDVGSASAVTPRRFDPMGGPPEPAVAEGLPRLGGDTPDVLAPTPTRVQSTFGAPLTPPARTTIPAPAPPSAAPHRVAAPADSTDVTAAFSTRSSPAVPTPVSPGQRRPINPFLANDPNQKARRLARALVSDMVAYHPTRREEGLQQGTLKQLFRDEIKKSYEEYVEQVGREFAESTAHFQEALNDVLAGGRRIF